MTRSIFATLDIYFDESSRSGLCEPVLEEGEPAEPSVGGAVYARGKPSSRETRGATDRRYSDNCFANPVRADVLLDGRKIAGAAQRRTTRGLLHQGSIQNT